MTGPESLPEIPVTTNRRGIPKQLIRLSGAFWVALSLIYYGLTHLVHFMWTLPEFRVTGRPTDWKHGFFSILVALHHLSIVGTSRMKESVQCRHLKLGYCSWRIYRHVFKLLVQWKHSPKLYLHFNSHYYIFVLLAFNTLPHWGLPSGLGHWITKQ